jgi:hypothetical protein
MGLEPTTFCMASLSACRAVPRRAAWTACLSDFGFDGCRLAERCGTVWRVVRLQSACSRSGRLEGIGKAPGLVATGSIVEVARGGLEIRMAHPLLEFAPAQNGVGRDRPEGVAQVVEAERAQLGSFDGGDIAPANR